MPTTYKDLEREWNHTADTVSGHFSFQIIDNNLSLRQKLYLSLAHLRKLSDAQNRINALQKSRSELEQYPFYKIILNISNQTALLI